MKSLIKKWWFWVIIAIIIFAIACVLISVSINDVTKNYKNQAISVLNKYKDGSLTGKQASDKLKSISDKIGKEPKIEDEYKSAKMLRLEMRLSKLSWDLLDDELSDTEINNNIIEITGI